MTIERLNIGNRRPQEETATVTLTIGEVKTLHNFFCTADRTGMVKNDKKLCADLSILRSIMEYGFVDQFNAGIAAELLDAVPIGSMEGYTNQKETKFEF